MSTKCNKGTQSVLLVLVLRQNIAVAVAAAPDDDNGVLEIVAQK